MRSEARRSLFRALPQNNPCSMASTVSELFTFTALIAVQFTLLFGVPCTLYVRAYVCLYAGMCILCLYCHSAMMDIMTSSVCLGYKNESSARKTVCVDSFFTTTNF